jgi:hypothetical protein
MDQTPNTVRCGVKLWPYDRNCKSDYSLQGANMVCLQQETALTLEEARKRCPTRPNLSTIWRWTLQGVRGVKLESFVFAGRRLTTVEALQRFQERTALAADGAKSPPQTQPTRRIQQKQVAAAKRRAARL